MFNVCLGLFSIVRLLYYTGVSFLSLPLLYLIIRYYICKIFGGLHQKGTFLANLVGNKQEKDYHLFTF